MPQSATHHSAVMAVLAAWDAAVLARDLDALSRCYTDDVVVFDIGSQTVGYAALRKLWEDCFPYFPNPIGIERKDTQATVGNDVAVLSFLTRVSGMVENGDPLTKSWFRATVGLRRFDDGPNGGWKIVHDHNSFAFNCETGKPDLIADA